MSIWEVDFYRRPLQDEAGSPLWELLVCSPGGDLRYVEFCPQPQVNADWLVAQFKRAMEAGLPLPTRVYSFRPQALSLVEVACGKLGIAAEPARRTPTLKHWLQERAQEYAQLPTYTGQPYKPIDLDRPPPVPLPENLWGDRWGFASFPAADLVDAFCDRPIPFLSMPAAFYPLNLGLASTALIPGVIITGGRKSMQLARWLQEARPVWLDYIPGAPDGLILEAGLIDRWVVATFEDSEMQAPAQEYEHRKRASQGLHFLLVQPDDSGITFSGFWLLKQE